MVLYVQYRSNCPTGTKPNLLASYIQPTFSQLDGDPPSHMPTPVPSSSPSPTTSPSTSTVTLSQSSPPVTPPCFSRPYTHPPPLPPTADSELMGIPSKSANFCCHCRTECPCIFGRPCRGCPARQGGRPHICNRCPGSWCHIQPPNFHWTSLVIKSVCDALSVVFFNAKCVAQSICRWSP